jgi:DNA-directed RNA polymerase specialized sigma24 family protein
MPMPPRPLPAQRTPALELLPGGADALVIDARWPWPLRVAFDRCSGELARVVVRVLGTDTCRSDELVEAAFLDVGHRLPQLAGPGELRHRLWRGVLSRLVTTLRLRRLRRALGRAPEVTYFDPAAACDEEQRGSIADLYTWLDDLPARERIAWVLSYAENLGVDQIAALCGGSAAGAHRRVAAAEQRRHRRGGPSLPTPVLCALLRQVRASWTPRRQRESWQCLEAQLPPRR